MAFEDANRSWALPLNSHYPQISNESRRSLQMPPSHRRTPSTTSSYSSASTVPSISSFGRTPTISKSGGGGSSDAILPRLHPGKDSTGFLVEVPGGGVWSISWGELIGLLMKNEATQMLPESHLGRKLAESLRGQNRSPQQLYPPPQDPSWTNQLPSQPSPLPAPVPIPPPTAVTSVTSGFGTLDIDPPSNRSSMYSTATDVPTVDFSLPPSYPLPSVPVDYERRSSFVTPLQRAFLPEHSTQYQPTASSSSSIAPPMPLPSPNQPLPPPPSLLPLPPQYQNNVTTDYTDQVFQHDPQGYVPATVSYSPTRRIEHGERFVSQHRETTRRHTQPYPQPSRPNPVPPRPPSLHSVHSVHSVHSAHSTHSSYSNHSSTKSSHSSSRSVTSNEFDRLTAEKPRAPRPLNSKTEKYLWNPASAQLYRITPGNETTLSSGEGEIIEFPPGSYHKVVKEDMEVLPSDGKGLNEWIRGQECLAECRFRFERKRPATIRAHFMACKLRLTLKSDPIRRLCELQTAAQRRFKTPSIFNGLGSATPWSSSSPQTADNASILSGSSGHYTEDDQASIYDTPSSMLSEAASFDGLEPYNTHFVDEEEDAEQAVKAVQAVADAASLAPTEWAPWLANYGLEEPTGHRPSSGLRDRPSQDQSFLSMDEDP